MSGAELTIYDLKSCRLGSAWIDVASRAAKECDRVVLWDPDGPSYRLVSAGELSPVLVEVAS